jgi:hypothetical protein
MTIINGAVVEGVLTLIDQACADADKALVRANDMLATLPIIVEASDGISNRDAEYWGVSESTVRRYKVLATIVALGDDDDAVVDLFTARKAVNDAFRTKGITKEMIEMVVADSDTVTEVVNALNALVLATTAEKDADETDEVEEVLTEEEQAEAEIADMIKKVTNWLTSGQGSLKKVVEQQDKGYILNDDQKVALSTLTDLVASINAKVNTPAPVAVAVPA